MNKSWRTYLKRITLIISIVILVFGGIISTLAAYFNYCENNPLDFKAGTRIHTVRPLVYDVYFQSGTLVLVKPADIRTLNEGDIISMVYNHEAPYIFNNERFISFEEAYYGLSLHGIVTERTQERGVGPLRGGHFVGVPSGSIPMLGSLLMWIDNNIVLHYIIFISTFLISTVAFILLMTLGDRRKAILPEKIVKKKSKKSK